MSFAPRTMSTSSTSSNQSSTTSTRFAKFGIGGAGNYHHLDSFSPIPSRPIIARMEGPFRTGIGGHGNIRSFEERALHISARGDSEQLTLQRKNIPNKRHYGIGGAGNRMVRTNPSSSADSIVSVSSSKSGAERLMGKMSGVFN